MSNQGNVLMLGTNVGSVDAVRYAQSIGYRVFVADHHPAGSGAKAIADGSVQVSTGDIPTLVEFARSHDIKGVLTGVSEFNIRSAITLTEALGLPFYCTREQWDRLMDKGQFRQLCVDCEMPSPATYYAGAGTQFDLSRVNLAFPCVVKPVDASSLRGISVCQGASEVVEAVREAIDASITGQILIEEFVDGDEFTAAYVVVDGEASLSSIDDRYPFAFPGMTTTFPILRIYPSRHTEEFIEQCDAAVRRICVEVGLENACVFFQGIRSSAGVRVFEAGLRIAGEAPYRFLDPMNGVNPLHHLVESSLGRTPTYDLSKDDPFLGGRSCAILSFVSQAGTVGEIVGLEEALSSLDGVLAWESRFQPGDVVKGDGTLRQIAIRVILESASSEDLVDSIREFNKQVDMFSVEGTSMVSKPSDELLDRVRG